MVFSSNIFLYIFLPVVLVFYYTIFSKSRTAQNVFLFASSIFFYAWGEPSFVAVLLASVVFNWLIAFGVASLDNKGFTARKKALLIFSVASNLAILFIYKYLGFTLRVFERLFSAGVSVPSIILPIGISFFTFQAMSYVIDVYRNSSLLQKTFCPSGFTYPFSRN